MDEDKSGLTRGEFIAMTASARSRSMTVRQ